jgi:V8-like Glu-specific endopeptidase
MSILERFLCIILLTSPSFLTYETVYIQMHRSKVIQNGVIDTSAMEKYHTSVARIKGTSGEESTPAGGQATGWAVDKNHLITAGHFCESIKKGQKEKKLNKKILVTGSAIDGSTYKVGTATIVAQSEDHDLCLLKSLNHGLTILPILGNMDLVQTEDPITTIGAPVSYFPVRRFGTVISTLSPDFAWKNMLFLNIDIQPGSSGSPVIWNGFVIGVIAMLPFNLHNSALAVRGDHLLEFVNKNILE